jgi:hypothetical protein
MYNGLNLDLGNLSRLSRAKTRSLSAENPTGAKGAGGMAVEGRQAHNARDLGRGWKVAPAVDIEPGETFEVANIDGPGAIQQIWITITKNWRFSILRVWWDHESTPSIEVPIGDFFGMGWGVYAPLNSAAVCVNPGSAFNCYWEMPFRKHCRIAVESLQDEKMTLFYQVNYTLTEVPEDAAYLHAQFRRSNPLPYKQTHTVLDGVKGQGHYVGTYVAWGANNTGWWGEGDQVLPGRRRVAHDLRNRHGGLLLRVLRVRYRREVPGVLHALRRHAPGHPARRHVPVAAALWPVPLARHGPDPVPPGLPGGHSGAGVAQRRAASAPAGRHRFDGVLVPGGAACAVSGAAGPGRAGSDLTGARADVDRGGLLGGKL